MADEITPPCVGPGDGPDAEERETIARSETPPQPQERAVAVARGCNGPYYCYVLQSVSHPRRTYVGTTNDRARRLRQHNGELSGGARYTHGWRPWRMVFFVGPFETDRVVRQFEWSLKHPRKRRIPPPHRGIGGRVHCAHVLITHARWRDHRLTLTFCAPRSVSAPRLSSLDGDAQANGASVGMVRGASPLAQAMDDDDDDEDPDDTKTPTPTGAGAIS